MQSPKDWLTPDALFMLQTIAEQGSFAAAARQLGLVPSALTYRVRQVEDALDVLLFDRSARRAQLTPAGAELLRSGQYLLDELDAVAQRVKRVATGWEPQLTIATDAVIITGLKRCAHPSMRASRKGMPSSRNCLMNEINTTPFSTAIPQRLMNPTAAGTDKYSPVIKRPKIPPIEANGRTRIIKPAKRIELNNMKRRKKIAAIVIGIMIIKRAIARSIFSN